MQTISHRSIATNGIHLHVAEAAPSSNPNAPLVVLCHGFPGLWYSWRHQLPALAAAGYRALAIDSRGYGGSDRPADPAVYDMQHAMDDVLGVLDALGERQ